MNTINVPHTNLVRHPRNMRLHYPLAEVRRMALSQADRVRRGLEPCVQPIIVTLGPGRKYNPRQHDPLRTTFTIVAGHLRHAGNAWLKDKAPLLNCVVRDYPDENAMLAEMTSENGPRSDPSPVEWGRHFQARLESDPALGVRQLARECGKSVPWVRLRLDLLRLSATAQELVDRGRLPVNAIPILLELADAKVQAKAARAFAASGASLRAMRKRVDTLLTLAPRKTRSGRSRPAVDGLPAGVPATLGNLRDQAREACARCDIRPELMKEPAWHLALAAAGRACDDCGLQETKVACAGCPLADVMRSVVASVAVGRPPAVAPERPPVAQRQVYRP